MTRLAVVIAAYDEEETVEVLTRRLHRVLSGLPDCAWEILYVVEGRDRTREILAGLAGELERIRVLYQEEPSGLGNAFRRGFAAALEGNPDLVVTMDADLNHQPEEIPHLLEAFRRHGCDILVGSRFLAASRVEGTPAWKRFLSGTTNVLMRRLYGLRVRDKTSGFRVYRAAALRSLSFENANFAFLPELLIRAHQAGMTLAEEPIHFIFRREGQSKMRFWATSFSYLKLLRTRFDRWSLAALMLLLTGLVVRAVMAFPSHKYPADADAILSGLCAFKILRGDLPVFFSAARIGAIECYLAAGAFLVTGPSRAALMAVALAFGLVFLVASYLFARALLGRRIACLALLFLILPSPSVLFWTYVLNGYPAMMASCAVILWLAVRLGRKPIPAPGEGRRTAFLLGLAAGVGLWHSIQTLGVTAPAGLWLLGYRRGLLRDRRLVALAVAGAVLGTAPLIAYNIKHPLGSLRGNYAARPPDGGLRALAENGTYIVTYNVPELLASVNPQGFLAPPVPARLRPAVLAVYAAAFLFLLALPLLRRRGSGLAAGVPPDAWALLLLVVLSVLGLNLVSAAGQVRGLTVRYVLPIAIVAAPILAVFVHAVARRSRAAAAVLAACVAALGLAGYPWPWTAERQVWAGRATADERLLDTLASRRIQVVAGGYWTVYPVAFLSRERIVPHPCEDEHDHYQYARWLQPHPQRWALLAWANPDGRPTWIHEMRRRTGLAGTLETGIPGYVVFFPAENPPRQRPAEFLTRMRSVCEARPY
ncbi:MAG TPA: glycosyltransferase [Thermoanaerobaculia bacterium]|nr:glycosyltransferase [Thermoanaerobaculia bacterium]